MQAILFFTLRTMFYLPLSLFNFISLLNFFLFPPPQFYYFPSSMILFLPPQFLLFFLNVFYSPPPPPHLFYIFFHPQIHRPPIDPTQTPHRPYTQPFFDTVSWIVKLYTTTATTFLLFFLHMGQLAFFDYFNRIFNLIFLQLF